MANRLLTDPNLPGVWIVPADPTQNLGEGRTKEPTFASLNGGTPDCPWRSGHPCHIQVEKDKAPWIHLDRFQRCLLCMLGEIRRELELRRSG